MMAARVMEVIAKQPDCAGQEADAVSAYTQVGMEDAPKSLKIPKSECPDFWIRLHHTTGHNNGQRLKIQWFLPNENCTDPPPPLAGLLWERPFEEVSIGTRMQNSTESAMSVRSKKTRIILISIRGWYQHGWKKLDHMWMKLLKLVDLREPTSFLDYLGCTQCDCKPNEFLLTRREKCSNHEFLSGQLKNYQGGTNLTQKLSRGPTTWKVMSKSGVERYCQLADKKTEQLYKVLTPCLDDHHFKKEELESVGEFSDVCSQIVLKCLSLERIGRPHILWSVNKLARAVNEIDKSLRQTLSSFESLHSSHKWSPTILLCGKRGSALSTGFNTWPRFCRRPWRH